MLQTLKDYLEEISLLPKAVKIAVSTALVFAIGFAVYFGVSNQVKNARIERLERDNFELNRKSEAALERASKAETNAANEALRAQSLETQLQALEARTRQFDEKINLQAQKSNNLRLSLDRVRSSSPANISTDELEKRLCARYGCGQKNGN